MHYSLETILYVENTCSVALLFCNFPLTRMMHSLNMAGHSCKKMQHCFGTVCSLIFQARGKDTKLKLFHGSYINPIYLRETHDGCISTGMRSECILPPIKDLRSAQESLGNLRFSRECILNAFFPGMHSSQNAIIEVKLNQSK